MDLRNIYSNSKSINNNTLTMKSLQYNNNFIQTNNIIKKKQYKRVKNILIYKNFVSYIKKKYSKFYLNLNTKFLIPKFKFFNSTFLKKLSQKSKLNLKFNQSSSLKQKLKIN
jgi:hypothetical protein